MADPPGTLLSKFVIADSEDRYILDIPTVPSLPGSPTPGQTVRYANGICIWEPYRNGGLGAWGVFGAPPLVGQQGAGGWVYASPTAWTYTAMPGVSVTSPVNGIYLISARGSIRCNQDGISECNIAIGLNGATWAVMHHVCTRNIWDTFTGGGGPFGAALGNGTVVTLRGATNGPSNSFTFGGQVPFSLIVQPVEFRP